jgi:hypothetical protein
MTPVRSDTVTGRSRVYRPPVVRRQCRRWACLAPLLVAGALLWPLLAAAQDATPTPIPSATATATASATATATTTPAAMATATPPPPPPPTPVVPPTTGWLTAQTAHASVSLQPDGTYDAETFVGLYGDFVDDAYVELTSFFGIDSIGRLALYVYTDGVAFDQVRQALASSTLKAPSLPDAVVLADPFGLGLHLYLPTFLSRSPREADGALRNAVAIDLLVTASNNNLPAGFTYGMALYAERPPTTRLARVSSMVSGAVMGKSDLVSWFELQRLQSILREPEVAVSLGYSAAAFLIDRYTVTNFQLFLDALTTESDWRLAMEQAYSGRKAQELETQWIESLSRWVSGPWRENLVAAFDLEPAYKLLEEARYQDAKDLLDRSQLLYSGLQDRDKLAEVQELLFQCDTGIQAEALMEQTHTALEHHTYDRAAALLTQAKAQYDRLPETHRPTELIATYEHLAQQGLAATAELEEAQQLGREWGDYPEARAAALGAGTTFAELGDEEMVARAGAVIEDLDARQRRLVLMLGALAALTGAWLALWLWARGKPELDWS